MQISAIDVIEMETESAANLMDLPVELRLDIFEHLDFKTLIGVGKTHAENRDAIERIFRNIFRNEQLELSSEKLNALNSTYELRVCDDLNGIMEFLEKFGHHITKLKLSYVTLNNLPVDVTNRKLINDQIRKYVAEFVDEVEFRLNGAIMNHPANEDITIPFPNAKVVTLENGVVDVATLYKMFPSVCTLDLKSVQMAESLNHFPSLQHFTPPKNWDWFNDTNFVVKLEETLQMNPQLRQLTLPICRWNIAEMLARVRPDLETLEISNFYYYNALFEIFPNDRYLIGSNGPIEFGKMRKFKFGFVSSKKDVPNAWREVPIHRLEENPFVFGSLEEIEFRGKNGVENWVRIMLENENLKKVIANDTLSDQQLERIANGLEKLEEFSMRFRENDEFSITGIVQFMQKCKVLKKASFFNVERELCAVTADQINRDWIYVENDQMSCLFTRKYF